MSHSYRLGFCLLALSLAVAYANGWVRQNEAEAVKLRALDAGDSAAVYRGGGVGLRAAGIPCAAVDEGYVVDGDDDVVRSHYDEFISHPYPYDRGLHADVRGANGDGYAYAHVRDGEPGT